MKKVVTTIALFAVLGTLAVSCQKENIIDETAFVEESGARYAADGEKQYLYQIERAAIKDNRVVLISFNIV